MKVFKSLIAAAAVTVLATGCEPQRPELNTGVEDALLDVYANQTSPEVTHRNDYAEVISAIAEVRQFNYPNDIYPFCDVYPVVISVEQTWLPTNRPLAKPLTVLIGEAYSTPYWELCGRKEPKLPEFTEIEPEEPKVAAIEPESVPTELTVTYEDHSTEVGITEIEDTLRNVKLLKEIREAAKGCRRAENTLLNLDVLPKSTNDPVYRTVLNQVERCALAQIESDINIKN